MAASAPGEKIDAEVCYLIGIIADEVTTTGFLLAGIGQALDDGTLNFLVVHEDDPVVDVEQFFRNLYSKHNFGLILIGTDIWRYIEPYYAKYNKKQLPIVMNIITKTSESQPLKLKEADASQVKAMALQQQNQ